MSPLVFGNEKINDSAVKVNIEKRKKIRRPTRKIEPSVYTTDRRYSHAALIEPHVATIMKLVGEKMYWYFYCCDCTR